MKHLSVPQTLRTLSDNAHTCRTSESNKMLLLNCVTVSIWSFHGIMLDRFPLSLDLDNEEASRATASDVSGDNFYFSVVCVIALCA